MLEAHRECSLMNIFPNEDVAANSTVDEVANHCWEYDIIQDYRMFHALRPGYDKSMSRTSRTRRTSSRSSRRERSRSSKRRNITS